MYKILIEEKSKRKLDNLKKKNDKKKLKFILDSLNEIGQLGLKASNTKHIGDSIYRKRQGRWRVVFTVDNNIIKIWIIDIEKDSKKGYKKWKDYVIEMMKLRNM